MRFEIAIIGIVISVLMTQVTFGALELPGDTPDYMMDLIQGRVMTNTDTSITVTTLGEACESAVVPFFEDLGLEINEIESGNGVIILEGDVPVADEESEEYKEAEADFMFDGSKTTTTSPFCPRLPLCMCAPVIFFRPVILTEYENSPLFLLYRKLPMPVALDSVGGTYS